MRALALAAVIALVGCRPTRRECEASWKHVTGLHLQGKDPAEHAHQKAYLESMQGSYVERCLKDGTRSQTRCLRAARKPEDLEGCK